MTRRFVRGACVCVMMLCLLGRFSLSAFGADLTFLPIPGSALVTIRVMIHTGPFRDPPGREGLAFVTAGVVSRGETSSLARAEILRRLFPMAADIRGYVGRETMVFEGTVHRDHLSDYYDLFREVVLRPRVAPTDVRRECDLVVNWLKNGLRSTEDEGLGKEVLDAVMHRDHPYEFLCTVDGVRAITDRDIVEFHSRSLAKCRIWVGVGGGYDEAFANRVRRDFGGVGAPRSDVMPPAPQNPEGLVVTLVQKKCEACAVSIGFPVYYTRADRDFFPLMIANAFLGEHRMFIGRLQKTIRMARGMNYGTYSYLEHFVQGDGRFALCGIPRQRQNFSIWIRPVKHEQAHFALRAALHELRRLIERGITDTEVEEYRRFVLANSRLWAQTVERRLAYLMDSRFYGSPDFLQEVQRRVARVTAKEVNAAIRRHWQTERLHVVMVIDRAEILRQALIDNTPSPITYEMKNPSPALAAEDREISSLRLPISPERISIISAVDLLNHRRENR